MDWGTVVLQVTAIVGALAALIAILNGIYELRERRQKHREQQSISTVKEDSQPDSPLTAPGAQASAGATPVADAIPVGPPRRLTNLPSQLTELIGREDEVAELEALLLRPGVRLVTLTGPAGVGKTRLALQAASHLLDRYADGVFFVPLAPVTDADLVVPTIAQVLDLREQGSKPLLQLLTDYLHEKHLLLVLDNFEQVTAAAQVVAELVAAAGRLSAIVTSREVLHIYGEHAFVVSPLKLPDPDQLSSGEDLVSALSRYEAVRLFVTRAQAADSHFALTEENAGAVAEIVNRLDGLPLAVELAAARIRLFPPPAMLQRLREASNGSSLQLLTSGPRNLPVRQQTLRNTIAWSYDLLEETEQALFERLGVFAGGWTLEAAEELLASVADADSGNGGTHVLAGLESLIGKSLVWQTSGGHSRFMMLQTIRDFALEQLAQAGLIHAVRQAHAGWFASFVEKADPQLYGPDQLAWLQRLDEEQENLRAALSWVMEDRQAEVALRLAGHLSWYWNLRGRVSEGRTWLESALAIPATQRTEARALALNGLAELVSNQDDWPTAWAALEESIAISRDLGDRQQLARRLATLSLYRVRGAGGGGGPETQALAEESLALARSLDDPWTLGYVLTIVDSRHVLLGDHSQGSTLSEEALRCFEAAGDQWGIVLSLRHLGYGAIARGDYTAARQFVERSLAASRSLGDRLGEAYTLNTLADTARVEGDYERAMEYYQESLALYRDLGLKGDVAAALHNLGHVTLARGDAAEAKKLHAQSLELHQHAGNKAGELEALTGLAAVAEMEGDLHRAARLFGAVEALRTAMAAPLWPAEQVEYDRYVAALRSRLDQAVLTKAWDEGRAMTLEQAVADAREAAPVNDAA